MKTNNMSNHNKTSLKHQDVRSYDAVRLSDKSPFFYNEAYNQLRMNVMFSIAVQGEGKKIIVVSSAYPNEGKTTLSANLAISLARLQNRVLVIDGDLRKPKLHRVFGVRNSCGLSDILLNVSAEKAIVGINGLNLDFLPAGTVPPNPSELLGSDAMKELLAELSEIYDYILIDTPPVLVVSDALSLSSVAAGMLVVCRYKKTTYRAVTKVLDMLKFANFPALGTVIVGSKDKRSAYRRYNRYNYYETGTGSGPDAARPNA